ncbi:MAG: polysaccharide deacetylase family protein [Legionellaceae bacterium]|nr:polysaccharide deacetylase family protein [Legionellaceae bacterium]
MLLIAMYHRIRASHLPQSVEHFHHHLSSLAQRYPIVIPGETLHHKTLNICLSFDDAYFDFFHEVFPLLQTLKIKAVLAIPVDLLAETVTLSAQERLQLSWSQPFDPTIKNNPALCSWSEISQMVGSGWVIPAAHGAHHQALHHAHIDLEHEIIHSQTLLEEKTGKKISSFIYPFGRYNADAERLVHQHYRYAMRIGSALNQGWEQNTSCLYRIDADNYWPQQKNIASLPSQGYHQLRFYWNKWRGK